MGHGSAEQILSAKSKRSIERYKVITRIFAAVLLFSVAYVAYLFLHGLYNTRTMTHAMYESFSEGNLIDEFHVPNSSSLIIRVTQSEDDKTPCLFVICDSNLCINFEDKREKYTRIPQSDIGKYLIVNRVLLSKCTKLHFEIRDKASPQKGKLDVLYSQHFKITSISKPYFE